MSETQSYKILKLTPMQAAEVELALSARIAVLEVRIDRAVDPRTIIYYRDQLNTAKNAYSMVAE